MPRNFPVQPPDREKYDDAVRRLKETLGDEGVPPLLIAHLCWRVIVRVAGSSRRALLYFTAHTADNFVTWLRVRCWWAYQRHVCGRTDEQVHELLKPKEDRE